MILIKNQCPLSYVGTTYASFTYAWSGCGAERGGFWHSHSATADMFTHTRSGRGRICHLLRTRMVWRARFPSGRGKLGVGPICCGADFAPAPPPLRDCAFVNACNDLGWSQFSACLRSAHVWTYLKYSNRKFFLIKMIFLQYLMLEDICQQDNRDLCILSWR